MRQVVKWLVIGAVAVYGYNLVQNKREALNRFQAQAPAQTSQRPTTPTRPAPANNAASQARPATAAYECNGRQHCSQMRSCAEARWVLQHCPNTKMDGDGDKIPCEDQLCGH